MPRLVDAVAAALRWSGESRAELAAGTDVELAVGAAEMLLDGFHRHEERLSDFLVGQVLSCHLRNPPFARRERLDAAQHDRAWMRASCGKLVVRVVDERTSTAPVCELDPLPQQLTSLAPAVATSLSSAEIDQRPRMLEPSRRVFKDRDSLSE